MPLHHPWLSSMWIGLVTPVDAGSRPPADRGPVHTTVVTDGSGAELFDVSPIPFMDALRKALAEDPETHVAPGIDRHGAGGRSRPRRLRVDELQVAQAAS